jgi:PAS domain S-box-containing protein
LGVVRSDASVFQAILDAAPDGVVISRDGVILFANDAAVRILGEPSRERVLGRHMHEFLGTAGARTMRERIELMRRTGARLPPLEYAATRADGSKVIGEVTSMVSSYEDQPAVVAFVRDVTERVNMREQLAATDRLAAVGTAAAGVAHEINNPLQIASLALGKLERQVGSDASAKQSLSELSNSLERIASIVRDLITFSRAEKFEREAVDVASALNAAARFVSHRLPEHVRLTTELGQLPPVLGSPHQVEQVVVNLLMNALQALPDGNGESEIVLTAGTHEGRIVIEVRDSGSGITPEILPRVFDPFFTTKPPGAGTGLGLAVCQGIVARHGGRMEIESEVGQGTTVRVRLPAAPPRDESPGDSEPRGLSILVIDDERQVVDTLERLLKGNRVVGITDGAQAVEQLDSEEFDVVLCDLGMRPVNGRDVYEAVAAKRPALAARFLFMTGGTFAQELHSFLNGLDRPPLYKPFDWPTLRRAIASIVEVQP